MNRFRKSLLVLVAAIPLMLLFVYRVDAVAPGPKVSEDKNRHNLSAVVYDTSFPIPSPTPLRTSGSGSARDSSIRYKAVDDPVNNPQGRQICIFCHTPHSANVAEQAPLWNRQFSSQTFSRYSSATLQIRVNAGARTPAQYNAGAQPDGSSKLCLSCHDGVSRLGEVLRGGPIQMVNDVISSDPAISRASFNPATNKMKFGHHPVSFVYNGAVQQAISSGRATAGLGGGFGFILPATGASIKVKLDKNSKMQCTTCHNPHQNQSHDDKCYNADGTAIVDCPLDGMGRKVAPFWVQSVGADVVADHDSVCTTCHQLTGTAGIFPQGTPPSPFPYPP